MGAFLTNTLTMSGGRFILFLLSLLSTVVYVRFLGVEGYAIIGIILPLFFLVGKCDIPYFFGILQTKKKGISRKKKERILSTLHTSVLGGNVVFVAMLLPLCLFLSLRVYENVALLPLYSLAILIFVVSRTSRFYQDLIRAQKQEGIIQVAVISNNICSFGITLYLILVHQMGVISVFYGLLGGALIEYLILRAKAVKLFSLKIEFSKKIFLQWMKKYQAQEYLSDMFLGMMIWGGLLVSSLFLDPLSFGALSIVMLITVKIREGFSGLGVHSISLLSHYTRKDQRKKVQSILDHLFFLLLVLFIVFIIFLLFPAKIFYLLLLGKEMEGTYFFFLLLGLSMLLWRICTPYTWLLFVLDPLKHNKLYGFATGVLLILLTVLGLLEGKEGVAASYTLINMFLLGFTFSFLKAGWGFSISKTNKKLFFLSCFFVTICLFLHVNDLDVFFFPSIIACGICTSLLLVVLRIKIKQSLKRVSSF